jgi:hypothetical protein
MKRRRKGMVAGISLVVLILTVIFLARVRRNSAEYHLQKLKRAWVAYDAAMMRQRRFRIDELKYALGFRNPMQDMKKHEAALLTMGYLRQTNFTLPSTNSVQHFLKSTRNAAFQDTNWSLSIEATNISLIAAARDSALWGAMASEANTK